jgi:hypothetical protein
MTKKYMSITFKVINIIFNLKKHIGVTWGLPLTSN